jgi:uncharacterized protein (TIGR03437 family)
MVTDILRCTFALTLCIGPALGQKPVVFEGGVVNAASFAKAATPGGAVAPGSIIAIFGANLAPAPASAGSTPLPTTLAGTSVTVNGIPAPLFYVSPGQINAQLPLLTGIGSASVVVATTAGASDPVEVVVHFDGLGIFTTDQSGCGPGAVLNVASDGTLSLNTPQNSVEPGGWIAIYATGLGATYPTVPDGEPAPLQPLSVKLDTNYGALFRDVLSGVSFAGKAPTLVGVDQFNTGPRADVSLEGCSVPLRIYGYSSVSQPVPISIHRGGGQCVDPPPDSYGVLRWKKTISSGITPPPAVETFSAEFPSAIGLAFPVSIMGISGLPPAYAASCSWTENKQLDAGALTMQGPGFGPLRVLPHTSGTYSSDLPPGTIRAGSFSVIGGGGAGVGSFTTTVAVPDSINLTTSFPPGPLPDQSLTVAWTGGDPQSIVRLKVVATTAWGARQVQEFSAAASDGSITITARSGVGLTLPHDSDIKITVTQTALGPQIQTFQAGGLTLGGRHVWVYEFRFGGLTFLAGNP